MELSGKIKRGGLRFMDILREDMQVVGTTKEDSEDRKRWKRTIFCGDLKREQSAVRILIIYLYPSVVCKKLYA